MSELPPYCRILQPHEIIMPHDFCLVFKKWEEITNPEYFGRPVNHKANYKSTYIRQDSSLQILHQTIQQIFPLLNPEPDPKWRTLNS